MCHERLPPRAAQFVGARHHQLEVDGVVGVGQDQELAVPLVDIVAQALRAWLQDERFGSRTVHRHHAHFGHVTVEHPDDDVAAGGRDAHADDTPVLLVIDPRVAPLADCAAEDRRRTALVAAAQPVQVRAIGREREAVVAIADVCHQQLTSGNVAHEDGEDTEAGLVDRPAEHAPSCLCCGAIQPIL